MTTSLIGHTISRVEVAKGEQYIRFTTSIGEMICLKADGDCCSETWFAEFHHPRDLIGRTVVDVTNIDIPGVVDGHTRQEFDSFYGIEIRTDECVSRIVYRNSSNGYYGGDWHYTLMPEADWIDISNVSDWTAYEVVAS